MTFWQENYAFMKDVYDTRANRMNDLMDKTDDAIADVLADKIYTSAEFKKVKEKFVSLARNLEQPEVKSWLTETKECLMGEKTGKEQDDESNRLTEILTRFDAMLPAIADTRDAVDALWRAYEYSDELSPLAEWLAEMVARSTREINADCAAQTEEHQERQEKTLDQLDRKRKVVLEQQAKGEKILTDPKAPKFLDSYLQRLKDLWTEANRTAEDRLNQLKDNVSAWERYERERDGLAEKLAAAEEEFAQTLRVYDLAEAPKELKSRRSTAADTRRQIEETFKTMSAANDVLATLLGDDKKAELAEEVECLRGQLSLLERTDERLNQLETFNGEMVAFEARLAASAAWLDEGRSRMDSLLKPEQPIDPQDRVMKTMELQSDVQLEVEKFAEVRGLWSGGLEPTQPAELTPAAKAYSERLSSVDSAQSGLYEEVRAEGAKFGEDVKHLAEFMAGAKKLEPWTAKAEAKRAAGMAKPKSMAEAQEQLDDAKKWKSECETMRRVLADASAAAARMSLHEDADAKSAGFAKRLDSLEAAATAWIGKLSKMVEVWTRQAETAAKVTAAIAAKPDSGAGSDGSAAAAAPEMKLEDLEKHLNALKQMFIDKQKMMDELKDEADPEEPKKETNETAKEEPVKKS